MIKLDNYFPDGQDIVLVSQAEQVASVQSLFKGVEAKRDEVRNICETKPKRCPEDLTQDLVYLLGFTAGLNWVLRLPGRSREFLEKIK